MRRNCKRVFWPSLGCLLAAGLIAGQTASDVLAAEPPFVTAKASDGVTEFEAIQDVQTGLMWGKDLRVGSLVMHAEAYVADWASDPEVPLTQTGGYPAYSEEHPDGWRPPTVTEVLVAREHGLLDYIDFQYWEGHQGAHDPIDPENPDSAVFGDDYFWTTCLGRWRGLDFRFRIRYNDGDYVLSQQAFSVLPVRGAPPDHSLCPKGCLGAPTQGNKPPKRPKK